MFFGSGGRNKSNSPEFARIGKNEIFDEHDVHHVFKMGIKRIWSQEAKMSLTAISSLESARMKYSINTTYIISTKWESNVICLTRPK